MNWSEWLSNPETRDAAIEYLRKTTDATASALTFGNPYAPRLARKAQDYAIDSAKSLVQAATLPGRALTGQIGRADEIPIEEAVGESTNFAGALDLGALGGAAMRGGAKAIETMPGDRLMMGADGSGLPPAARRATPPPIPPAGMLDDPRALLRKAYDARAAQMDLDPAKRIQPDPSMSYLDRDYQTPRPGVSTDDISTQYPRSPKGPDAPLPKHDRVRLVIDNADAIADRLAQKIRDAGGMEADTRYFYHSDGPIYRGGLKAGLNKAEATSYVDDFSSYVAATSPRTEVEDNIRNATSAMAKTAQGIPHREIVGPGSGGISERGYPMMTEVNPPKGRPPGIHGTLLDTVIDGRSISRDTNTKPSYFKDNVAGNRSGATVDTHAIRGTLITLNEIQPGAAAAFVKPEFKQAYLDNPAVLRPNMIDDSLQTQAFAKRDMQTEYPVFADIMHKVADRLGVSPAEAQSMAWFGLGDQTNLGSMPKTIADVFDERLSVTAQALGIPVEEAAKLVYRRQIPLLATGGGAGLLGAMQPKPQPQQEEYR